MSYFAKWPLLAWTATGALWLAACTGTESEPPAAEEEPQSAEVEERAPMESQRAVATLMAKSGSNLEGEAFFVQDGDEIAFGVDVKGISPGLHAVHIHENGDCSADDASSAGGHWNPTNQEHGKWGRDSFHLGDIGNIEVGEDGQGTLSMSTDLWSLEDGDERSVVGKAVVVHAGADDFETQPAGGAGARIGCGVIEWKTQT